MTDKSELKLAEGSRWLNETTLESVRVTSLQCITTSEGDYLDAWDGDYDDRVSAMAIDVLAAIRAVDGDPEYLELKRLRAENEALVARCDELQRERDDLADQIRAGHGG